MAIAESILPEFDHETATTRTLLERVPEARPAGSRTSSRWRLASSPCTSRTSRSWTAITLERTEFDTNPPDGPRMTSPAFQSASHLLHVYDANVSAARALLARTTDAEFMVQWTLKNGGKSHVQHAARGGVPLVHPESRGASSRPVERISSVARRADPKYLRTNGGHLA